MTAKNVLCLYDNDTEIRRGPVGTQPIHFAANPRWLKDALVFYGGEAELTVLVSEHDPHGRRFLKYGAELVSVNGNRPQVLAQRLPNLLENIRRNPPWMFFGILSGPELAWLLEAAAAYCVVMVWVPGNAIPAAYLEAAERARQRGQTLRVMLLSEIPFLPRQPRVRVFVDGENLLGSYKDRNARPDPTVTDQALYQIAARYGEVASMMYLGDWGRWPCGNEFRAGLENRRREVNQVDSRCGKNSSDHVLVQEVMKVLDNTDCLVIYSDDADFRHLCQEARSCGVRVVCVGTRDKLTGDMKNAADDVAFLDDVLPVLRAPNVQSIDDMLQKIVLWVRENDWYYVEYEKLFDRFGTTPDSRFLLEQIIREEYLIPGNQYQETRLRFNPKKLAV